MPRKRNSKFIFYGEIDGNRKNFFRMIVKTDDIRRVSTIRYTDMDKDEDIFDAALQDLKVDERIVASRINKIKSTARLEAQLLVESNTDNDVIASIRLLESLEKWGLEK